MTTDLSRVLAARQTLTQLGVTLADLPEPMAASGVPTLAEY